MEPMGMTLGRLYVDANFDESTKTTVRCNFDYHPSSVMIGSQVYTTLRVVPLSLSLPCVTLKKNSGVKTWPGLFLCHVRRTKRIRHDRLSERGPLVV